MYPGRILIHLLLAVTFLSTGYSTCPAKTVRVDTMQAIDQLLAEEDTDGDKKITVDDFPVPDTDKGNRRFFLESIDSDRYVIYGTYHLANLLQELTLQKQHADAIGIVRTDRIFENPVRRISRQIGQYYWDGLTRRIDAQSLHRVLPDSKLNQTGPYYLYVPHEDPFAYNYFSKAAQRAAVDVKVLRLRETITPEYVKSLEGKHGLLPLALRKTDSGIEGVPFVVPGGRFNEMYGWDSYFEALGLLADDRIDLAKAMVDNFVYEIRHYGKILNANRTYYLTRSQPPFLTSMTLAVYEHLPKTDASKQWLRGVLAAAIKEYQTVWMNENHLTETGLSRYYGSGLGIPPEVEQGHFDPILKPYAAKHDLSIAAFRQRYEQGRIDEPELDRFFRHDRAVRESGHDTTYRWRVDGRDRAADFVTVDLNALLYKYELDIAFMLDKIFADAVEGQSADEWYAKADKRKRLILKYLWNPDKHLFFDYCLPAQRQSGYISATTFYPLWACCPEKVETKILTDEQVKQFVPAALSYLEAPGGILATAKSSLHKYGNPNHPRQWEYPNGWAPHQMIAWKGLQNYGCDTDADRLIYKWLYMITVNAANYNGTIPEKFDVVGRSHAVFAEYGNVGTEFAYMTKEGFGWMNASYQMGLEHLSEKHKPNLETLIPPEWLDFE